MDKISDFFKDLKERLSNPLFSSFILAWLITNWKIPIGLLLYKISDLKIDGYNSYIDLIKQNSSAEKIFYIPLGLALSYTFIFPFIKNIVLAFNAWIKGWGNSWSLKASKSSKISISKYMELRDVYQKRTQLLEDVLEKESKYLKENEELRSEKLALLDQNNDAKKQLQDWNRTTYVSILDGTWEYFYTAAMANRKEVTRLHIINGQIEYLDLDVNGRKKEKEEIKNFYFSPWSKQMSFLISSRNTDQSGNKRIYNYFYFDTLDEIQVLRGTQNEQFPIEFRKTGQ